MNKLDKLPPQISQLICQKIPELVLIFKKSSNEQCHIVFMNASETPLDPSELRDAKPEDLEKFFQNDSNILAKVEEILQTDENVKWEYQPSLPWTDEKKWIECFGFRLDKEHAFLLIRSIDEVKRIFSALEESEERFRTLFQTNPDANIIANRDGFIEFINPSAMKMFAIDPNADLKTIRTVDFYDTPELREKALSLIQNHSLKNLRLCCRRQNGETFPGLLSASVISLHGQTFFYGSLKDISEYDGLMDRIRISESRRRSIIENFGDGIILIDSKNFIILINGIACEYLRIQADKVVDLNILTLDSDSNQSKLTREVLKAVDAPTPYYHEFSIPAKEELLSFFELSIHMAGDDKLVIIRDITSRKVSEEERHKFERMQFFNQITGQIAHDFNNLLSPLIGIPDLLRHRIPQDLQTQRLVNMIQTSASQMVHINQQLSILSKCGQYFFLPINVNEVIETAISIATVPEEIKVRAHYDPELMPVKGDESQLIRVFMNLITNILEAMGESGDLTITTKNTSLDKPLTMHYTIPAGEYVEVMVMDTGRGIDANLTESIYQPFFYNEKASDDQRSRTRVDLSA